MTTATAPRYVPLETVPATECRQTYPVSQNIECPDCRKNFVGAASIKSPPVYSKFYRQNFITRTAYCDHCNMLIVWDESCDGFGIGTGTILTPNPTCIKPTSARKIKLIANHLTRYPQLAGVEQ